MRRFAIILALLTLPLCHPHAATIQVAKGDGGGVLILISGEFQFGDDERFATVAADASDDTTVVLSGPGGNLSAGLKIGSAVRMRAWKTMIADGDFCASACGLIWLGGVERTLGW